MSLVLLPFPAQRPLAESMVTAMAADPGCPQVRAGRLGILGFAGNTAPDHTDHFHALEHWLRRIRM